MSAVPPSAQSDDLEEVLAELLGKLDLPGKVRLLSGADFWTLPADETIGLRPIVFSDGPAGIRGDTGDERKPSLNLPSGSALGATWDTDFAGRYGDLLGREALRKEADVILGPTINLQRSPYGGRHFEAMSEDPMLTGRLAAAYVAGIQAHGVAACPKHYVANDYEIERNTASSEVEDRALRELYLAAFEDAVVDAHAWVVMSAYNGVNGTTMSENDLLETPLKSEWGFDGVVLSDWIAVKTTEASANSAQDVVMPDMFSPWGDALVEAVRVGKVAESAIDEKVLRVLRLAARVGALDGVKPAPRTAGEAPDPLGLIAELGAESMVLLRNNGELPWAAAPASIAVIGPNAICARTQGGGSAGVIPERVVSPLEGVRNRFPEADVTFTMGVPAPTEIFPFNPELLHDPVAETRGVHVVFSDADDAVVLEEVRLSADLTWMGNLPENATTLTMRTRYTPETTERCDIGVAVAGSITVDFDGVRVIERGSSSPVLDLEGVMENRAEAEANVLEGLDLAEIFSPKVSAVSVDTVAGTPIEITAVCDLTKAPLPMVHAIMLGMAPRSGTVAEMLADAAAAAAAAEVAVVVVGTSSRTESEGFDRTTLAMPGGQDALVEAVRAANPRTVVVVNSGSPVLMPWHDQVSALLLTWFGGQQTGVALAEVLAGDREPGGRLPTTWPGDEQSVPIGPDAPVDGKVHYDEGIEIGHRAWLRRGATPAYCFGHGLGYTSWSLSGLNAPGAVAAGDSITVSVEVANTGDRAGKQVVQVYAARETSDVLRPVRWLAGWGVARVEAGGSTTLEIEVPARSLAAWVDGAWWYEPGSFELFVGTSVDELELQASVEVRYGRNG